MDEALLERLRLLPQEPAVDDLVKKRARTIYYRWSQIYSKTPGLQEIAGLIKTLPTSVGFNCFKR